MSINLQNYVSSFLLGFNNSNSYASSLTVLDRYNSEYINFTIANRGQGLYIATTFFLADAVLFIGVIVSILLFGLKHKTLTKQKLVKMLITVCSTTVYLCILINIWGFIIGLNFLSTYNLSLFNNSYTFTIYTQSVKLLLLFLTECFCILSPSIYESKMQITELPLLVQISLVLCCVIISSTNFVLLLLALEGFSLTLYIMTALGRVYGGVTAAVKYFAFGTLGSIFLFWGAVHIYTLVPSFNFNVINMLLQQSTNESSNFNNALEFATTAITLGFMLKLGAAPLHQWVADVYAGSHMYVTAFFSIFVKFVLFAVFLNIALCFNCDALLKLFILLSLVIGCFLSIRQSEIKRLLAYSSIVHIAFLLMGDLSSSVVYLLTYIISSLLLFSILLNVEIAGKELIYLNDLRFVRSSSYFQVFCFIIALSSSAGLPPFAGFYGKFLVWSSLVEDIYLTNSLYSYIVLCVSIAISLITIYYYMRLLAYLFIGTDSELYISELRIWSSTVFKQPNRIASMQILLCSIITLWTFIQAWFFDYILCIWF